MSEKSTIQTSRKMHALKHGIYSIIGFNAMCIVANLCKPATVDASVMIAVSASIGTIVTGLQIADGIKGHEPK